MHLCNKVAVFSCVTEKLNHQCAENWFSIWTLTLAFTLALALYQCVSSDPYLFKLLHRTGYIPACIEEQVVGQSAPFNHSDAAASFSCASWNSQLFEMLNHIGYI